MKLRAGRGVVLRIFPGFSEKDGEVGVGDFTSCLLLLFSLPGLLAWNQLHLDYYAGKGQWIVSALICGFDFFPRRNMFFAEMTSVRFVRRIIHLAASVEDVCDLSGPARLQAGRHAFPCSSTQEQGMLYLFQFGFRSQPQVHSKPASENMRRFWYR